MIVIIIIIIIIIIIKINGTIQGYKSVKAWPNARNILDIFNATCQCLCAPGPWRATSGPSAHALVQQCCVNVAKQVQHHATSKMLHEKFDRFQI